MRFRFAVFGLLLAGIGLQPIAAQPDPAADSSNLTSPANNGWQLGDFLVATWKLAGSDPNDPAGIAVYDQNLVFKCWVDLQEAGTTGLNLTSSGNAVDFNIDGSFSVVEYSPSGAIVGSFPVGDFISDVATDGLLGKTYTSDWDDVVGIREWDQNGNWTRTFGTVNYGGICLLPGGILWAVPQNAPGEVHVFDIASGAKTGTIPLDNSQGPGIHPRYSPSTNTVLFGSTKHALFERTVSGAFVRKYTYPFYPTWYVTVSCGTRGPGGDVYGVIGFTGGAAFIGHWRADGTWVGQSSLYVNGVDAFGIEWTGPDSSQLAPTISGPDLIACVLPGSPISFQESATDPEGTLTTLSASNLPPGATFPTVSGAPSVTGTFNWTPTGVDVGSHTITFQATDSGSPPRTSTRNALITVVASSPISSHPQPVSICAGQTATFSTTAAATAYQWQWSKDGINWIDVSGATSSSYSTPPFYWDGYFRCIVTASCGQTATNPARITITPIPGSPGNSLRMTESTATSMHLVWSTATAATQYRVLRCAATTAPCTPSLLGTASKTFADDTAASAGNYWYSIEAANACGVTP